MHAVDAGAIDPEASDPEAIDPEIDAASYPDRFIALRELGQVRHAFENYDWQLDFLKGMGEELFGEQIERRLLRSNIARVSVQRGRTRKVIWDEGFFDMVFLAMVTAAASVGGQDQRALTKETAIGVLRDGGTALIVSHPYRALVLQEKSHLLRRGASPLAFGILPTSKAHVENMFRLARNFCLLHEIGHLAEASEAERLVSDKNLEMITATYLGSMFERVGRMVGGGDPRAHLDVLRRALSGPATQRELRADIYALTTLFTVEFAFIDASGTSTPDRDKTAAALLTYQALAILHYVQSNVHFVARYASTGADGAPKSLTQEDESRRMIKLRGDVRLFLAALFPQQILNGTANLSGDEPSLKAYEAMRDRRMPDYSRRYLELCEAAIGGIMSFDRAQVFHLERRLATQHPARMIQREALRNIGWIG
jgi:hypothetical protein